MQYSLAQHVVIKHKKQGSICAICGHIMSEHHLEGHFDTHCLSNRYICKEKKRDGVVCNKDYHQKQGLVRHLNIVHHQKSFDTSKVKVLDKKECVFETKDDYTMGLEEHNMNN